MATGKQHKSNTKCGGRTKSGRVCRNSADDSGYCAMHRLPPGKPADFSRLGFKELLAACPLDGIELVRASDEPRTAEF